MRGPPAMPFLLPGQTLALSRTNTGQTLKAMPALTSVSDCFNGSPGRIRTADQRINSRVGQASKAYVLSHFRAYPSKDYSRWSDFAPRLACLA